MDVHALRRDRLRELLREIQPAELARRSGVAASLLTRYCYEPDRPGAKNLGEENARKLERAAGKPLHWLDRHHSGSGVAQTLSQGIRYPAPTSRTSVPVKMAARPAPSGDMTMESEQSIGAVEAPLAGARAFAVKIVGDALYPALRHGMFAVCDPDEKCTPGEPVLLQMVDGSMQLRELVFDRPDEITTMSLLGSHRETVERSRVLAMIPVTATVYPSRWHGTSPAGD